MAKTATPKVATKKVAPKKTKKQIKEEESLIAYRAKGKAKLIEKVKEKGISRTTAKLMVKYNAATIDDYRKIRKANKARIKAENKARDLARPKKEVFVKSSPNNAKKR